MCFREKLYLLGAVTDYVGFGNIRPQVCEIPQHVNVGGL